MKNTTAAGGGGEGGGRGGVRRGEGRGETGDGIKTPRKTKEKRNANCK